MATVEFNKRSALPKHLQSKVLEIEICFPEMGMMRLLSNAPKNEKNERKKKHGRDSCGMQ